MIHRPSHWSARIEGEFPDARYFSVQSYDDTFSPVASIRDFEVVPSIGSNHFAKKATNALRGGKQSEGSEQSKHASPPLSPLCLCVAVYHTRAAHPCMACSHRTPQPGKYKIFVTKDGSRGLPNELPMSHSNFSDSSFGAIIFRLYGVDPLADTKKPALKTWGYKDPPTISLRSSGYVDKTNRAPPPSPCLLAPPRRLIPPGTHVHPSLPPIHPHDIQVHQPHVVRPGLEAAEAVPA